MEALVSAVLGDLISRSISFAVDRCCHRRRKGGIEDSPLRLRRVLLRVQAVVEEADRRRVTNQAMLRQLQLMREGVYRGYYLLSAFKSQGAMQGKTQQDREVSHSSSSFALSQFNPAKRLCTVSARTTTANVASDDTRREGDAEAELREVLTSLERMANDMKELVVFLSCYPPTRREPYSGHLWLENRMFGREAEQERIMSFLLETEPPVGTEDLGVLPVIGRARVGKSTLVEHVCLDERVRKHFSLIVFLGEGDIEDGNLSSPHQLGDNGIIKHRHLNSSAGKSLVVIELDGDDVDESTLGRILSALRRERTAPVRKILVTSRSEKIASFGTTRALELKPLPREAYWYFFKTIAFGSTDAGDQPELASVCMEIAGLLNRSFIAANLIGGLLRANPCSQFWRKVLKGYRDNTSMHLLLFGEHQSDLLAKDRPVYFWRLVPKTQSILIVYSCYQVCSPRKHGLPKITANDVQIGRARPRGKFEVLAWRSHIPPYYSYMLSSEERTSSSALRIPARNKQIRQQ
ncbi:hypothetical protein SEVIR_5G303232v4 [Setaria viridis]